MVEHISLKDLTTIASMIVPQHVDTNYPKLMTEYWQGVPNDLDTVFHSCNGHTYFFKENNYYRFNFTKGAVDAEYPRHMAEGWRGILYNP